MPVIRSTDAPTDGRSQTTHGMTLKMADFVAKEVDYLRSVLLTAAYSSEEGLDAFLHEAGARAAKLHSVVSQLRPLHETETPQAA